MPPARRPKRETDLYDPVHQLLTDQGYEVRAEVGDCDIVASRGDELVVVELKRSLGVHLLAQAVERQRLTDSVYVALPAAAIEGRRRQREVRRLLRRLDLGLILVHAGAGGPLAQVVFQPLPYRRRRQPGARRALVREMAGRLPGQNVGGSTRRKRMTVYRQDAVYIACCLEALGPLSPKRMRKLGCVQHAGRIAYLNHYGWFERIGRGVYGLAERARAELADWPDVVRVCRERLAERLRDEEVGAEGG